MIKIRNYTDDEIKYIIDNYSNYTNQEIADYIGKSTNIIYYVA